LLEIDVVIGAQLDHLQEQFQKDLPQLKEHITALDAG
jgi:hypothetical protein